MINLGQAIKEELELQERSVSWFASKLGCDRQTIYRIFKKYSIDTELLCRISIVLQRNFLKELGKDLENMDMDKDKCQEKTNR